MQKGILSFLERFLSPLLFALTLFIILLPYKLFSPGAMAVLLCLWLYFHRASLFAIGLFLGIVLLLSLALPRELHPPIAGEFYAYARVREVIPFLHREEAIYRVELLLRPQGVPRCLQAKGAQGAFQVGDRFWTRCQGLHYGKLPLPYTNLYPLKEVAPIPSPLQAQPLTPARAFYEGILHNRFFARGEEFPEIRAIMEVGLAHLMSISGVHIGFFLLFLQGLLLFLLYLLPWRVLQRIPRPLLYYGRWGTAFLLAYLYLQSIGMPPASVRALYWILLLFLSARLSSRYLALDTFVLFVILLTAALSPCALPTLSFALSLTAMIYLTPLLQISSPLARVILGCLLPWLGTLPLLVDFAYVSPAGPLANLVGVPFFGLWIFPLAWAHELLHPLPFLRELTWDLYTFGFYLLVRMSRLLLELPLPPLPQALGTVSRDLLLFWCALPLLLQGFWERVKLSRRTPQGLDPPHPYAAEGGNATPPESSSLPSRDHPRGS